MRKFLLIKFLILWASFASAQVDLQAAFGFTLGSLISDGSYTGTDLGGTGSNFTMTVTSLAGSTEVKLFSATELFIRNASIEIAIDDPDCVFNVELDNYKNLLTTETVTIDALPSASEISVSQYNRWPATCSEMIHVNGTAMTGTLPVIVVTGWGETPTTNVYTMPVTMTSIAPCYSSEITYGINDINEFTYTSAATEESKEGFEIRSLTVDCIVLPTELVSFEATCERLSWITASEMNCSHFEIEASLDGVNWNPSGVVVSGSGNSAVENTYVVEMPCLNEVQYYRLVQYNFDGEAEAQMKTSVSCDHPEPKIVDVYDLLGRKVDFSQPLGTGLYLFVDSKGKCERRFVLNE